MLSIQAANDDDSTEQGLEEVCSDNDMSFSSSQHGAQPSPPQNDQEKDLRALIIRREERAVRGSKCFVVSVISLCAVFVSVAVFFFAKDIDSDKFETQFGNYAEEIISLVQWEVQYNFALMQQLSASITSTVLLTGATLPNFTQPHFEIIGGYADGMGGIMSAAYAPLVKGQDQRKWEEYSVNHQEWLEESARLKVAHPGHRDPLHGTIQDHEHDRRLQQVENASSCLSNTIYRWENGTRVPQVSRPDQLMAPLWQVSPHDCSAVNADLLSDERLATLYQKMVLSNHSVLSPAYAIGDLFDWFFDPADKPLKETPHAFLMEPVYDAFEGEKSVVGILVAVTSWRNSFTRLLPKEAKGIVVVIKDDCGNDLTYVVDGPQATYVTSRDDHDKSFDHLAQWAPLELNEPGVEGLCLREIFVYPSKKLKATFDSNKSTVYTAISVLFFFLLAALFVLYDTFVSRRQEKTMQTALKTNRVLASLFPENVRDQVMATADEHVNLAHKEEEGATGNLKKFRSRPIAEYFAEATIMFADIAGFTAWASTREPFQVFLLLEALYGEFDEIAKKRRVFKVETVGDCYVAVCGLPKPMKNHAVVITRFAGDCLEKMHALTKQLEVELGPDTAELGLRIGLHTGPVTGGVLRGDNARYQLFGDTMNMAARMEQTGTRNRVQCSTATANLLVAAGKGHWVKPREDKVAIKGKGECETHWLVVKGGGEEGVSLHSGSSGDGQLAVELHQPHSDLKVESMEENVMTPITVATAGISDRDERLVDWNAAVLLDRLKAVVAQRQERIANAVGSSKHGDDSSTTSNISNIKKNVQLSRAAESEMRQFVLGIATMYRANPFHNFSHASHVTMSVTKLLSRVAVADESSQHSYLQGITSDSLAQFAVVFSALIHDVDHTGVSNKQLSEEGALVAKMYNDRSVAENNSIAVAWEYLMLDEFKNLRSCICPNEAEQQRFKDLVVNTVLATDIVDKDLKEARNARWEMVFGERASSAADPNIDTNRAKIVLEHLIQASDVCHMMQHFQIYRKWNTRLFQELVLAYENGRAKSHPADFWYEGELGFFDHYIIPLAKKLKECGVFGVASFEYLNYACSNRAEWESRGREIVSEMMEMAAHEGGGKKEQELWKGGSAFM